MIGFNERTLGKFGVILVLWILGMFGVGMEREDALQMGSNLRYTCSQLLPTCLPAKLCNALHVYTVRSLTLLTKPTFRTALVSKKLLDAALSYSMCLVAPDIRAILNGSVRKLSLWGLPSLTISALLDTSDPSLTFPFSILELLCYAPIAYPFFILLT